MEEMESPLNVAHRHQRKAEDFIRVGKFAEAYEHHAAAAKSLREALKTTTTPHVVESLKAQHDHHLRQQAVVKYKERLAEIAKEQKENEMKSEGEKWGAVSSLLQTDKYNTIRLIQQVMLKMWQHDIIVNSLVQVPKSVSEENTAVMKLDDNTPKPTTLSCKDYVKLQELHTSNEGLKRVLYSLFRAMDDICAENRVLKKKLSELLEEHSNYVSKYPSYQNMHPQLGLQFQQSYTNDKHYQEKHLATLSALKLLKLDND